MSDFFARLKKTISKGASESAAKVEEAARMGKIRLEILNENRKLAQAYEDLGAKVYASIEKQDFAKISEEPEFIENLGKVKLVLAEIEALKTKLEQEQKKAPEAKAKASASPEEPVTESTKNDESTEENLEDGSQKKN